MIRRLTVPSSLIPLPCLSLTSYAYDLQSNNIQIVNPLNEMTTIQWDALGREIHRILANGGTISHTFDPAGRETLIQNISAAGVAQAVFTNSYSPNYNRLTVAELDGTLVSYGYDAASQLTLEQRNGSTPCNISYTYDPNANRLTMSSSGALTAYQYNAANEQILITPPTGAPTTQTFDPAGNLTLQNTGGALTTQTWSPENRLLSISNPDGSSEQNTYSADGLRKSKTSAGTTTNFTWDIQNLLLETNTSNVVLARYTDFPGKTGHLGLRPACSLASLGGQTEVVLGQGRSRQMRYIWGGLASQNRSGVSSFYLYDSQGSVRNLASTLGAITDTYIYTAFGVELLASGSTVNPFRYVGLFGYYVVFVDLYYIRERWLDAVKGRWDSRDPIGFTSEYLALYVYVNNEPLYRIDPSGESPPPGKWKPDPSPGPPVIYNPGYWNDPSRIGNNNCTCYAYCFTSPFPGFLQPGELSGSRWPNRDPSGQYICSNLIKNSLADGLKRPGKGDSCKTGWHLVALYISRVLPDYHWYRRDSDGTWSEKDGNEPATNCLCIGNDENGNEIIDPGARIGQQIGKDAGNRTYSEFCAKLCAPNQWKRVR